MALTIKQMNTARVEINRLVILRFFVFWLSVLRQIGFAVASNRRMGSISLGEGFMSLWLPKRQFLAIAISNLFVNGRARHEA